MRASVFPEFFFRRTEFMLFQFLFERVSQKFGESYTRPLDLPTLPLTSNNIRRTLRRNVIYQTGICCSFGNSPVYYCHQCCACCIAEFATGYLDSH